MSKHYPIRRNGQEVPVVTAPRFFKFACCDCGLVHRVRFRIKGRRLYMTAWRDARATGQVRRHRKS